MNKELNSYLNSISKGIIYPHKDKKELIDRIKNSVLDLIDENPDITFEEVTATIGTAEDLIKSYNQANIEYIKKKFTFIKFLYASILLVGIIATILMFILL